MRSFFWLIPIGFVAACVGESPVESVKPASSETDGGSSDSGTPPPVTDGQRAAPTIELTVEPTTVVRGGAGAVVVKVVKRVGAPVPVTLKLQGAPPEFSLGEEVLLGGDQQEASLHFTAGSLAAFGSVTLQVHASAREFEVPVLTNVEVSVRGAPGSLDTSFGAQGSLEKPAGVATIQDFVMAPNGELLVTFGPRELGHYDANGKLDTTFGTAGRLQIPLFGTCEFGGTRSMQAGDQGWLATGFCGEGSDHLVHAQVPFVAPFDVSYASPGPVPVGWNGLGAGALFAGMHRRTNGGFVTAWSWDAQYSIRATVKVLQADGSPAPSWPATGVQIEPTADIARENDIVGLRSSNERVFVLATRESNFGTKSKEIVTLDVATATKLRTNGVGLPISSLSSVGPGGGVLAVLSGSRPCVYHVTASADLQMLPAGCSATTRPDARDARGLFLRDGRVLAVSVGSPSTVWTFSADGQPVSPFDGTLLQDNERQQQQILSMYEDAQHRLVIAASDPSAPEAARFYIRRFWL